MRESVRELPNLKIVERGLWKGPDITTTQSVVINHYERVPVEITKESIPSGFSFLTQLEPWFKRGFINGDFDLYPSVRSRYAQLGLNISNEIVGEIGEWLRNNTHMDEKGHPPPNEITPLITVENRGSRPVILEKGTRLFRFFNEDYRLYLQDDELVEAVKSGLIKIQGERLGDWTYSYGQVAGQKQLRPVGVFIRINSQNRRWIPPHPENKPIHILDSDDKYRDMIDSLLKPTPEEKYKTILWIGETIKVTLKPPIDAILEPVAIRGIGTDRDILDQTTWGTQINSRLIDGGKTDWAIRTEVISPTSEDRISNFVLLRFVKGTR